MDANSISTLISSIGTLGFSSVFCLILLKQNSEQAKQHREEMLTFIKSIDSLESAINVLISKWT